MSQVSNRRRWWRPGLAALLALTLCGCFQTKDEFTLEADGSGRVRIETRVLISPDVLSAMNPGAHLGGEEPVVYPPLTEMDARRLFPARDFKLTVKTEKAGDDGQTVIAEASFKDVNILLASPYARAHAMSLKIDAGQLVFQAVSGLEAAARLGEVKDDGGFLAEQTPGLKDVLKKKDELRHEFRVTLPGAVTAPAGAVAGRTVTWMAERTKHTNAAEFAQTAGMVLAARCAADGVKFTPATPTRLALGSFSDVPSGELAVRGAGPDVAKVKAAAKFVPYALQVTRALDLSGEGGGLDHQAQLFGAMVVPREFTPKKWGEVTIDEVVDAKGNNLKIEGGQDAAFGTGTFEPPEIDAEEDDEDKPVTPATDVQKSVTLRFQPPDWKVKEIARIKASMALQYLGGAQHIVKMTNAVPAKWIREAKEAANATEVDLDVTGRALSHPALPELGLTLSFQMGMAEDGFTMLMVQVGGNKGVLTDAQVFDVTGRPWPTFLQQQSFGEAGSWSINVAGRPAPPLSLALLVTGVGAEVEVPILVEKVPVGAR